MHKHIWLSTYSFASVLFSLVNLHVCSCGMVQVSFKTNCVTNKLMIECVCILFYFYPAKTTSLSTASSQFMDLWSTIHSDYSKGEVQFCQPISNLLVCLFISSGKAQLRQLNGWNRTLYKEAPKESCWFLWPYPLVYCQSTSAIQVVGNPRKWYHNNKC